MSDFGGHVLHKASIVLGGGEAHARWVVARFCNGDVIKFMRLT